MFFTWFGKAIYMFLQWKTLLKWVKYFTRFYTFFTEIIKRQCKSVFTEHLHAVLKAVNFL